MILDKLWRALQAQLNKFANGVWGSDPIAQMQLEYDRAVDQLKEGRVGLEQYRALVERLTRQVTANRTQVANLEARVKAYLQRGDRETAARFAVELQRARTELQENENQLQLHEQAYNNNLTKVQHASGKLAQLREKIHRYDADLKMSRAEAEIAQLAESFNFNVTTDFGEVEQLVQDRIGLNRAKARVAADLSGQGLSEIEAEREVERAQAEDVLREFEVQMGLVTPETGGVPTATKELGPASRTKGTVTQG